MEIEPQALTRDKIAQLYLGKIFNSKAQQVARDRINWIAGESKGKVLDVGCSEGILELILAREGKEVVGVDNNKEALSFARDIIGKEDEATRNRVQFYETSAYDLDLKKESFDTLILSEVLEHIANPRHFLKHCLNFVKEEGTVIITVPFGYLPFIDHKQTFTISVFLQILGKEFSIKFIDIKDQYIRCLGTKSNKIIEQDFKHLLNISETYHDTLHQNDYEVNKANLEKLKSMQKSLFDRKEDLRLINELIETFKSKEDVNKKEIVESISNLKLNFVQDRDQLIKSLESLSKQQLNGNDSLLSTLLKSHEESVQDRDQLIKSLESLSNQQLNCNDSLLSTLLKSHEESVQDRDQLIKSLESLSNQQLNGNNSLLSTLLKSHEDVLKENQLLKHELKDISQIAIYNRDAVKKIYKKQFDDRRVINEIAEHLLSKKRKRIQYKNKRILIKKKRVERLRKILALIKHGLVKGLKHPLKFIKYTFLLFINILIHPNKIKDIIGSMYLYVVQEKRDERVYGNNKQYKSFLIDQENNKKCNLEVKEVKEELRNNKENKIFEKRFIESIKDLNVAAIMDEFTTECFSHEVNLVTFTTENWNEVLTKNKPDLLFVESCWRGNDSSWGTLIFNYKNKVCKNMSELEKVIGFCKNESIPTVFWNKEDPPHYESFAPTAKLFDFVYTSDETMIPKYKEDFGIDACCLPFYCQPKIHNPINIIDRKEKAVFAGSHYGNRPERCDDFESIITALEMNEIHYDIFDRNFGKNILSFNFPEKYQSHIIGKLEPGEMWKANKGYKFQINLNSVKYSSTMFARRVFESLASGTPVISNYSWGVNNFFGDIVIMSDNSEKISQQIKKYDDDIEYNKLVVRGIRKALDRNTLSDRINTICERVFGQNLIKKPSVTVVANIANFEDRNKVIINFKRQKYSNLELYLSGDERPIPQSDYYAVFNPNCYYGSYYINDLCNAIHYVEDDIKIITKGSYLKDDKVIDQENAFSYIDSAIDYRSLISYKIFDIKQKVYNTKSFSTDYFGYMESEISSEVSESIEDSKDKKNGLISSWFFNKAESPSIRLFNLIKKQPFDLTVVHTKGDYTPYPTGVFLESETYIKNYCTNFDPHKDNFAETYNSFREILGNKLRNENYDFIFSRSMSMRSHEPFISIKKANPELPWIAFFGDPIKNNPYMKDRIEKYGRDLDLEKKVYELADAIIVPNKFQKKLSDFSEYSHKIHVLPHTYSPEFFNKCYRNPKNEKFTFIYLGWLYSQKRQGNIIINIANQLVESYPEYKDMIKLEFYGRIEEDLHQDLINCKVEVEHKGSVNYTESLEIMCRADALVNIDAIFDIPNDGIDYSPFLPGKLIDYMGAKKPIYSITMRNGATAEILDNACIPHTDGINIKEASDLMKKFVDGEIIPDFEYFEKFNSDLINKQLSKLIEETIDSVSSEPFYSIIIPVYNTEAYLPLCIESVLTQKIKRFEIIVVNDGSPGNCKEIVESYQTIDKRITYVELNENRGLFYARKKGFSVANGKYCLTIDSDDYMKQNCLSIIDNEIKAHNPDIFEFSAVSFEDDMKLKKYIKLRNESFNEDLFKKLLKTEIVGSIVNKVFKRELFSNNHYFNKIDDHIIYREDILFNSLILFSAKSILRNENELFIIRRTGNSSSTTFTNIDSFYKELLDTEHVFEHIKNFLIKENVYTKYKELVEKKLNTIISIIDKKRIPILETVYSQKEVNKLKVSYQCLSEKISCV